MSKYTLWTFCNHLVTSLKWMDLISCYFDLLVLYLKYLRLYEMKQKKNILVCNADNKHLWFGRSLKYHQIPSTTVRQNSNCKISQIQQHLQQNVSEPNKLNRDFSQQPIQPKCTVYSFMASFHGLLKQYKHFLTQCMRGLILLKHWIIPAIFKGSENRFSALNLCKPIIVTFWWFEYLGYG